MKNLKNKKSIKQRFHHFVHPAFIVFLLLVVVVMSQAGSGTFLQGYFKFRPVLMSTQKLNQVPALDISGIKPSATDAVLPALTAKPISITNAQGQALNAYVYKPVGNGPFSAVVVLHGCSGLMTGTNGGIGSEFTYWGNLLSAEGYVVIFVDSFTTRNISTVCGDGTILNEATVRPLDAYAGLSYLEDQAYVNGDKIALMGWSNGASAALSSMAKNGNPANPVDGTKFVGAVVEYPGCGLRAHYGTDYSDAAKVKLGTYLPYAPVQILAAENDMTTPPTPKCVNLVARAQTLGASAETGNQINMTIYPAAQHGFDRAKEDSPDWTNADITARDLGRSAVLTFLDVILQ
ncbi:prolyl oligopeptidase family serine peptidase [Candidatus Peregrinibacteria bacterium]|nr:prolyl oligopeptidase family serine peptidase [Candidatus Peregrinibacteria bacterium]